MYRPPNWKNPLTREQRIIDHNDFEDVGQAYEAGADAMYNALWKMAEESPTKTFTLDANVIRMNRLMV